MDETKTKEKDMGVETCDNTIATIDYWLIDRLNFGRDDELLTKIVDGHLEIWPVAK